MEGEKEVTEYFIVIIKEGTEPVVLPDRFESEEIARKCSESLTRFTNNDCTIKLMEDNCYKVKCIDEFKGICEPKKV